MTRQEASWQHRNMDIDEYDSGHEYPLASVLGTTRNVSHRRINGMTVFCAVTLALWILAMCF